MLTPADLAPIRRRAVEELAAEGASNRAIAKVIGVDESTIRADKDAGNPAETDPVAGADAGNPAPPHAEPRAELAAEGASTRDIGEVLGVDHSTVVRDRGANAPETKQEAANSGASAPPPHAEPRAELGTILRETPKATGGEHGGKASIDGTRAVPSNPTPTLASLGIDRKTSARAQRLAEKSDRSIAAKAGASPQTVTAVRAKAEAGAQIEHHPERVGSAGGQIAHHEKRIGSDGVAQRLC